MLNGPAGDGRHGRCQGRVRRGIRLLAVAALVVAVVSVFPLLVFCEKGNGKVRFAAIPL